MFKSFKPKKYSKAKKYFPYDQKIYGKNNAEFCANCGCTKGAHTGIDTNFTTCPTIEQIKTYDLKPIKLWSF